MFGRVVFFVFFVWSTVCYAAYATVEKVSKERFGGRLNAVFLTNVATWLMSTSVLIACAYTRWMGRPSIAMEYAYVGMVGIETFFYRSFSEVRDWEKPGVVAFLYVCVVYTWTDNLLLRYAVTFAFFRSLHSAERALKGVSDELNFEVPDVMSYVRIVEFVVLGSLTTYTVWQQGAMDPIVFGLNFSTVFGPGLMGPQF